MLVLTAMLLCACGAKDQSFSSNGLTMDLPGNYERITDQEASGYTFAMGSSKSIVMGLKEGKDMIAAYGLELNLDEYTEMVLMANNLNSTVTYEGNIPTFTFVSDVNGVDFKYLAATYEGQDAFWLIQFACKEENFDNMYDTFVKYLKTVNP